MNGYFFGRLKNGLKFNGVNSNVTGNLGADLQFQIADNLSISYVVSPLDFGSFDSVFTTKTTNEYGITLQLDSGKPSIALQGAGGTYKFFQANNALPLNLISYVTTTVNASWTDIKMYVNGIAVGVTQVLNNTLVPIIYATEWSIGGRSGIGTSYFNGYLFNLCVFNAALSSAEISANYLRDGLPVGTSIPKAIRRWEFLNKQGTELSERVVANIGTLANFANTTLGVNNAWVNAYTLQPITS